MKFADIKPEDFENIKESDKRYITPQKYYELMSNNEFYIIDRYFAYNGPVEPPPAFYKGKFIFIKK